MSIIAPPLNPLDTLRIVRCGVCNRPFPSHEGNLCPACADSVLSAGAAKQVAEQNRRDAVREANLRR